MFPIADENEPGHGLAYVTGLFILVNIAVFVLLQLPDPTFTYAFSTIPLEITTGTDLVDPQVIPELGEAIPQAPGPDPIHATLLTSMFMHGGWLHLGGNMLFLWIFGDNVEHFVGHVVFPIFYVAAGVVASIAQVMVDPDSVIPTLGASGAISGVMGAYLILFPTNRVTVFLFRILVPVPALIAVGMWAVFQFINGLGAIAVSEQTGGVAYMAHIGGFLAGVVAGLAFRAGYGPARRRATQQRWG